MSEISTEEMAKRLRHHASRHPTLMSLKADLPSLPGSGPLDEGLYLDSDEVPGLTVNGELRVSVARVFSVGPDGARKLVGQIQATRVLDHPLEQWSLSFYVHVHRFFATHKVEDETQWFVRVLEQHYKAGGEQVALEPEIEA